MEKKILFIIAIALVFVILSGCTQTQNTNPKPNSAPNQSNPVQPTGILEVHFIDLGQGDSELIIAPSGKTLLIDAGDNDKGDEVVAYLNSIDVNSIDFMLSSHYHADHIGGSDYVLENISVGKVFDRGDTYDSETFRDYVSAAGSKRTTIKKGDLIDLGEGITARVLQADFGESENNKSIVLELSFGSIDFLFGGDCESECENSFIAPDIEVYKVHHHGSNTSNTQSFLNAITPTDSIIEVGAENEYGHPTQQTLNRLNAIGSKIYRTDEDGTIVFKSDGKTYWKAN